MAYYINKLQDGKPLPIHGKAEFLLANVPGSSIVRVDDPGMPGIIDPYRPALNTFDFLPDLVCVAELAGYDVACCVDIPRQLELCQRGNTHCRKIWLIVPGAKQLAGVPTISVLTDLQRANAQLRYAWPLLVFLGFVAWPVIHLYFDQYPGYWAGWGLAVGYLTKRAQHGYDKIKKL